MSPSMLSPGEYITEQDLTTSVVAGAVSTAAYVGRSSKGPVFQKTLVTNEDEFVAMFGKPDETNYEDFFVAASFLLYSNTLYFTRVVDPTTAKNSEYTVTTSAASAGAGAYIQDYTSYVPTFGGSDVLQLFARYPGDYGDTECKVALINYTDWSTITTSATLSGYKRYVEYGPESSDEFLILVAPLQSDGVTYSVEFVHLVSRTQGALDNFGNNIYVDDAINNSSAYILAFNNTAVSGEPASFALTFLANGADGNTRTNGSGTDQDILTGYDLYDNKEEIEINYLLNGGRTDVATQLYVDTICQGEARRDCIGILGCIKTDVVNATNISTAVANVIDYRKNDLNLNSSYSAFYANWAYMYDKYNDKNRWVPITGHIAGIYAYTAAVTESWFAPAGLDRGQLRNVIKLAINPNKAYRDQFYQEQCNPIVAFPGQGTVVWGQKTLLNKPSAFDRVNVRLLFFYMERAIAKSARYCVFQPNDSLLASMFTNMVKPFLEDIKGRRGVYDFLIDVSSKVNTPERMDRNEFWANIYIKPTRAAEYINLNFIATKTGVDFAELQ